MLVYMLVIFEGKIPRRGLNNFHNNRRQKMGLIGFYTDKKYFVSHCVMGMDKIVKTEKTLLKC